MEFRSCRCRCQAETWNLRAESSWSSGQPTVRHEERRGEVSEVSFQFTDRLEPRPYITARTQFDQ